MIGRQLAHYSIVEKLGEGGMGVVYRAIDTHLDRHVALKVLPAGKVADPDRKRRFVQEAKAASALNHPNIVTVHDIAEDAGVTFMAMELIEGQTLDQLIGRKGLKLGTLLRHAIQIAAALAKAHAAGIVHRDLKPSNVMVTDDGLVKVLDFGLAKLTEPASPEAEATRTIALDAPERTREGVIVGTASYMSPEQAEGKPVDSRSDIFSFGAVLYEMVAGKRAFSRDSAALTLAAVLREEPPPVSQIAGEVPRDLEKIIARCLRKDPARRFQGMADVKVALEELKEESDSGSLAPASATPVRRSIPVWMFAAVLAVLAAVLAGGFLFLRTGKPGAPLKVGALAARAGIEWQAALSPDGKQIAFVWNGEKEDNDDIYVQLLDESAPRRLTTDPAFDFSPVWSPDGLRIAFLRQTAEGTEVRVIPAAGGVEKRLHVSRARCRFTTKMVAGQGCGISWSPDGRWLTIVDHEGATPMSVFRLDIETRALRRLTKPASNQGWDGRSVFSPDGRSLVFARATGGYPSDLFLLELSAAGEPRGEPRPLTRDNQTIFGFDWSADGRSIVFSSNRAGLPALWRVPASGGEPERLPVGSEYCIYPSVARKGDRLAYSQMVIDYNVWRVPAPGSGAADPPLRISQSPYVEVAPAFSPDGRRITFASNSGGPFSSWVCGIDGSQPARLTSMNSFYTRWSPDGRQIVFAGGGGGKPQIYRMSADGGTPGRLTPDSIPEQQPAWSRDGKWVYFSAYREPPGLWKVPAEGGSPVPVVSGGVRPVESFDGKFLYYFAMPVAEIRRIQVAGGEPETILKTGRRALFTISEKGIYVLDPDGAGGPAIEFTPFGGGPGEVLKLGGPPESYLFGIDSLAVSRDGRWALYSHLDRNEGDIMLGENFR